MKAPASPLPERPVLLLVGPLPPPFGGIANITAQLAVSDLQSSFRIRTVNVNLPSEKAEIVSEGKRVNLWKGLRLYGLILTALWKHRPQAVIVEMNGDVSCFREALAALLIRLLSKATIITHFHGGLSNREGWRGFPFGRAEAGTLVGRAALQLCFAPSHRVAFLAGYLADQMRPFLTPRTAHKLAAVENFVATREFLPHQQDKDGRLHVLFMGRLSKAKGFFNLLEAIPGVVKARPDVQFWACGAPETDHSLDPVREAMNALEAAGSLRLFGIVQGDEKRGIYARADLLVYPSHADVFPVTILEALAQGLPIITTRIGQIPHIVREPENVLFAEIGDTASLRSKTLSLIENPARRRAMSEANRALACSRFDISVAARRFQELLHASE